jgi:hypothetical protein
MRNNLCSSVSANMFEHSCCTIILGDDRTAINICMGTIRNALMKSCT